MNFYPQTTIKGKTLANLIAKFTYADTAEVAGKVDNANAAKVAEAQGEKNSTSTKRDMVQWTLYMDGTFNDTGSEADIMLISPEGHKIHYALRFGFKALKNEVEEKALIAGSSLAREFKAHNIQIYSDSQLVVNEVNVIYLA